MTVEVSRRTPDDNEELTAIYAGIFGERAAAESRARWDWQYRANPHAPEGPALWVVRQDGRPVGQMGTMPAALWWGDREVRASWGMDYFVRPDLEGRGHGVRLARAWMQSVDVALAAGLTPPAYAVYLRLGFRDLGHIPFFQAVLDPAAVLRRRFGGLAGVVAGPVLGAALAARRLVGPRPPADVEVVTAGEIGAEYDTLWAHVRGGLAAGVRRDSAYVRWKYRESPVRSYELLEARRGGALAGIVVIRHAPYEGLRLGWVVDLIAGPERGVRDALLAAALAALRRAGVARVEAVCANAALAADLRRHGFLAGRSRVRLCVWAPGLPDGPLRSLDAWHIMRGDGDLDR
jgi:hypothetical protein